METQTVEPQLGAVQRVKNFCIDRYVTLGTGVALVLANATDPHALSVQADSHVAQQAELAIPSALPAPNIDHGMIASNFVEIAGTMACAEVVQRRSSVKRLLGIAAVAQVASCFTDGIADRTWLNSFERHQADVGTSAICAAWLVDYFLTRARSSAQYGKRWLAGAAVFAGTMAVGLPIYEASNGGKLDLVSHGTGLLVGTIANFLRKPIQTNVVTILEQSTAEPEVLQLTA